MSTRLAKQFVYGAFYALVWILVIWFAYSQFAKPAPSCFDHIQNQNETGIDCGGVCALACGAASAQPVAVGSVQNFITSPGHVTFLAQLTNPNANLAAENVDYNVNLYDASNTLLYSIPGQTFLYANEVKYVVLPNQILGQTFSYADLLVQNVQWTATAQAGGAPPQFTFQNIQGSTASSTVSVGGQIKNSDVNSFATVIVIAIFKGADGTPIGASETQIENFSANTTQSFSVIYPNVAGIDPSRNQVFAYALRQ